MTDPGNQSFKKIILPSEKLAGCSEAAENKTHCRTSPPLYYA